MVLDVPFKQKMSKKPERKFDEKSSGEQSSPPGSPMVERFLIPSPVPTRRTRTYSQSERARAGPVYHGRMKSFCRHQGHGFIIPNEGNEPIFVHISDIEGDIVPVEGDEVSFKRCPVPPKFEKFCAVHVMITRFKEGVQHERWDSTPNPHDHD